MYWERQINLSQQKSYASNFETLLYSVRFICMLVLAFHPELNCLTEAGGQMMVNLHNFKTNAKDTLEETDPHLQQILLYFCRN